MAIAQQVISPVIALVPIGRLEPELLEQLRSDLSEALDFIVQLGAELELPDDAYDRARQQTRARRLNQLLAEVRQPEWSQVLGVTDVDLFAPRLRFVFGEADPAQRVAVFSLERLHDADAERVRRRALTEALHELGHALGLDHCEHVRCAMRFSNTLADTDEKGDALCARHAALLVEALASE